MALALQSSRVGAWRRVAGTAMLLCVVVLQLCVGEGGEAAPQTRIERQLFKRLEKEAGTPLDFDTLTPQETASFSLVTKEQKSGSTKAALGAIAALVGAGFGGHSAKTLAKTEGNTGLGVAGLVLGLGLLGVGLGGLVKGVQGSNKSKQRSRDLARAIRQRQKAEEDAQTG